MVETGRKAGRKNEATATTGLLYSYCHYWPTGTATATTSLLVQLPPLQAYWYSYCHYRPIGTATATTCLLVQLLPLLAYWYSYHHY